MSEVMEQPTKGQGRWPKKDDPEYQEGVNAQIVEGKPVKKNVKWCGKYVRVKIHNETYNPKGGMFEFGLGDHPKFYVAPNVECIMPVEIFSVLSDTTTEVIDCDMDNARQGQRVEYGTRINVRIPYQWLGEATEAEYKAQMIEQRQRPPYKPLK